MDWCETVFIVLQYIPEFAEIHVHWVGDAMQPSHPLLSPSLTLSLSQYKCLFQWIRYLYQVTKVLDPHRQHQSSQWTFSWFPLGLTGLISLLSKGLSRVFSITTFKSVNSPVFSRLYGPTLTSVHDYWKNNSIDYMDLHQQVMSLLFNMLSRFVIASLPKSKQLLILWLWSPTEAILEPKKINSVTVSIFSPSICYGVLRIDAVILGFFFFF